mgnify:CR=1 FL=1
MDEIGSTTLSEEVARRSQYTLGPSPGSPKSSERTPASEDRSTGSREFYLLLESDVDTELSIVLVLRHAPGQMMRELDFSDNVIIKLFK